MERSPSIEGRLLLGLAAAAAVTLAVGCGDGADDGPGLGAGAPTPTPTPVVRFVNDCAVDVTVHSSGPSVGRLTANGGAVVVPLSAFNQGQANLIIPYPDISAAQCSRVDCDQWTALGGQPGTKQREGWMWDSPNDVWAAYCNPNLSGFGICALQNNCCGPGMVQDGTFGTTFELTPNGGGGNDYVDLSTNYGSGPMAPPALCPTGGGTDCVTKAANIFYNVPIAWMTDETCSFTTANRPVSGLECVAASCPDAYQHPTDDKQAACPSSSKRNYVVTFCPPGAPLPPIPTPSPADAGASEARSRVGG